MTKTVKNVINIDMSLPLRGTLQTYPMTTLLLWRHLKSVLYLLIV